MKYVQFKRLEITSNEIDNVRDQQMAYITDKKCIVYRDLKGKFHYFEESEELKKAIEDSASHFLTLEQAERMRFNQ